MRAFFDVPGGASVSGQLSVSAGWLASPATRALTLPPGPSNATTTLAASNVALWWPVGLGPQAQFDVNVTFTAAAAGAVPQTLSRRVGFKTGYLVTADDANPAALAGVDGSGNLTYRWKVNGADLWARGGNIIPIDEMEGRFAAATYEKIVDAAADSGMNALRVWGGGIYPPDVFYERAAARGVLIRHDAMFAGDGRIPPSGSALEDAELRQQVRRIAAFPVSVLFRKRGFFARAIRIHPHHPPETSHPNPISPSFHGMRAMNAAAAVSMPPSSIPSWRRRTPRARSGRATPPTAGPRA